MKITIHEDEGLQLRHELPNEELEQFWEGEITSTSKTLITVKNPLHAARAFFAFSSPERVVISNFISDLIEFKSQEIDFLFAIRSIVEDERYGHETLWKKIKCIPPGSALHVSAQHGCLKIEVTSQIEEELNFHDTVLDPMEVLSNEIKRRANIDAATSISVNFSGGCDSMGLLLAARSVGQYPVSAATWTYNNGSAHEDLIAARDFTNALGIRHLVLDIDPKQIFESPAKNELTPNVSTSIAFHHFRKVFNSHALEQMGSGTLVLNGHGGDHLYLDPVPIEVIFDAYQQGGLKSVMSTLSSLASLYGENYLRLLKRNWLRRANASRQMNFFFNQEALEALAGPREDKEKIRGAKQIHKKLIRQAIYQNSTAPLDERVLLATPFTSPGMIASVWNAHPMGFFDRSRTRIPFRNSMNKFTTFGSPSKSVKGHVTGAFQQALKIKREDIFEIITNGMLSGKRIINTSNVIKKIDSSAQGYGGFNPILLKIICFELMMRAR